MARARQKPRFFVFDPGRFHQRQATYMARSTCVVQNAEHVWPALPVRADKHASTQLQTHLQQ
eukprot:9981033-Alexandrium_andersonii.AAC.1